MPALNWREADPNGEPPDPQTEFVFGVRRRVNLGRCLIGSIDDVSEAMAAGEGENFL